MINISFQQRVIEIREMKEGEKEAVRDLLIESYIQYQEAFEPERWEKYFEEVKAAVDNEQIDTLIVARSGNRILGTVQLFRSSDLAYDEPTLQIEHPIIRFLAVHPDGRGLGIAKKLLDQSIEYAQKNNAQAISLHTTDIMEKAVKLYERYGFKRNEIYDYDKNGVWIHCYTFESIS